MDYRHYLLYTREQELAFRAKYAAHLHLLPQYEDWFYTFPLYEWHKFQVPSRQAEFIIGMLCLLLREGRANYCFKFPPELDGEALIMRYARDKEEYQEYTNKLFNK